MSCNFVVTIDQQHWLAYCTSGTLDNCYNWIYDHNIGHCHDTTDEAQCPQYNNFWSGHITTFGHWAIEVVYVIGQSVTWVVLTPWRWMP
jgi:hypothetical protein